MPLVPVDTICESTGCTGSFSDMLSSYGRYRCSGLSNAARLGIGIGIGKAPSL
jgi:hypothetical protein